MAAASGAILLVEAGIAVVALVVLIARFRLNPFVALVLVSLALSLAIGMPPETVVKAFEAGVGSALGHIALVVGLGTILGKMMIESGGAERIAETLIARFGPGRVDWAMMTVALIVGLPVFFEVGFVLLVPIMLTVARRTGMPLIRVGLPMAAGLSVVHALVPPHPAALLAVEAYHADIGGTILAALVVGVPTAALAGPIFARFIAPHLSPTTLPPLSQDDGPPRALPPFGATLLTLLLPVILMLLGSAAGLLAAPGSPIHSGLRFIGNSVVALLIAVLVSYWTLGRARGFDRDTIQRFSHDCLAPTAAITLVVGGGAGFGRVLIDGGVSGAIVTAATGASLPLLPLAWLIAALLRVATGSATVAMATAAGILAPLAAATPGVRPELLVLATGAGSVILSHVNDGGFWLVKEYFGLSVPDTIKSWTVCETLISVTALLLTLMLAAILG